MTGRVVRVAIVIVWVVLVGVLVRQRWQDAPLPPPTESAGAAVRVGDEWLNVYHRDQKIGYVHHRSWPADGGFQFEEDSLLRLVVMDAPQTVRTNIAGHVGADYAVRDFRFELSSGVGTLRVRGTVQDRAMELTLASGADESHQRIPLTGPVYVPATLRDFVAGAGLRAGRQLQMQVFDPAAMRNDTMQITIEQQEPVPHGRPDQPAWRVREELHGIKTTAWIDETGAVLREEGPMDLVLVRADAHDALHGGWNNDAALDLVQTVAVPVTLPIENPREIGFLRLRLRGIDLDQVPSDDARQRRAGDTWTITREDLATVVSYPLPYAAADHGNDLAGTPLLQVDHPRVRAAAADAVGDERDALRTVRRLMAWITGYMRQAPTVSIPNALQVLDERQGDCNEHAVLFAALARAVGLPTKVVAGVVYLDGAFYYHAWDEVWLGRWVQVDPVFKQFPADPTHIKFVEGGPEEHFAILQIIGRLGIDVLGAG